MLNTALIVTTINSPNRAIQDLSNGAKNHGWNFIVIGDKKSPSEFNCDGAHFYSLQSQLDTNFSYAKQCPVGHYARKNIGYLIAAQQGAELIVETDDDNLPTAEFWNSRTRIQNTPFLKNGGWTNTYRYFSDALIWPRGFPLDHVRDNAAEYQALEIGKRDCPIQQGLADENPDVDAIYRLLFPLPQNFAKGRSVALADGTWCPFNSQNTTWWSDAFPLLYLPAKCSFRMTDIWRSLVAQRIAWECGWDILFHDATVWQERNEHNLMRDFSDEISGYLGNKLIVENLSVLKLEKGKHAIGRNLRTCYEMLIEADFVGEEELELLQCWLDDLSAIQIANMGKFK
ncbi:STELLO glycosyltransferase family protein [Paludibacterium purpuratum]|nr:STELLO glycosyltransferase family protein [Paludibacterium purpuratum]